MDDEFTRRSFLSEQLVGKLIDKDVRGFQRILSRGEALSVESAQETVGALILRSGHNNEELRRIAERPHAELLVWVRRIIRHDLERQLFNKLSDKETKRIVPRGYDRDRKAFKAEIKGLISKLPYTTQELKRIVDLSPAAFERELTKKIIPRLKEITEASISQELKRAGLSEGRREPRRPAEKLKSESSGQLELSAQRLEGYQSRSSRLKLPPNKREELNDRVVRKVNEFIDGGKGTHFEAFVWASNNSKRFFNYQLSLKAIEGRYQRNKKKLKD
jgi:hypothetical protein